VEIDGGNRMAKIINGRAVAIGRHTQDADYEKMNESAILGWRVASLFPCASEKRLRISAIERILK